MTTKIKYIIEYIFFLLLVKFLAVMPLRWSVKAGSKTGLLLYMLSGRRRKITSENISRALRIGEDEADELMREVFENIGKTFAEFTKIPFLDQSFFDEYVDVEGYENYLEAKSGGKGVLLLSAHLGNWELLGTFHQGREGSMSVVYRKTNNPLVNGLIDSIRKSYGLNTIPSKDSARKIMSALKKGGSVGILLDQHAPDSEAVIVDFFGRPASTSYGLALIALKTGTPVVPVFMTREKNGRFRCVYDPPVYLKKGKDLQEEIRSATETFNEIIEKHIRKSPEQWFWLHRRWKV